MRQVKGLFALIMSLFCGVAFAASLTVTDVYELNRATPGTEKTELGTKLRGPLMAGGTISAACTAGVVTCNTVATTENTAVTLKTTGASYGESLALADGYAGQMKTYVLVTDGGMDFYVTPTTKTGFTSVQLNDAKDSVTLRYVDSTTGWVIAGNNGATVN